MKNIGQMITTFILIRHIQNYENHFHITPIIFRIISSRRSTDLIVIKDKKPEVFALLFPINASYGDIWRKVIEKNK